MNANKPALVGAGLFFDVTQSAQRVSFTDGGLIK